MNASKPSHPSDPAPTDNGDGRTVSVLRKIESGAVDPKCISLSDRRQLVGFLIGDGYSTAEMAQILQVRDRTIERDKKAIRESNAIACDPKLLERMVGRLSGEAELSVQQIRKAIRGKNVSPSVKIEANHRCFEIVNALFQSMQRVGYLPTAAQKVEAELTHHVGDVPDYGTTLAEVGRLRAICEQQSEANPEVVQRLQQLHLLVDQAHLASQVEQVSGQIPDTDGGPNDHE